MALDDDHLLDLIDACYDAALDRTRWPAALERLRGVIGAEAYDEIARRIGRDDPMRPITHCAAPCAQPVSIQHRNGNASHDLGQGRLPDRLLTHLDRCRQIRLRLAASARRSVGLAAALDRLTLAVLLLDAAGRIVHGNEPAERLLRAGDGLAVRDGRITATSRPETDRLHHLIATAARGKYTAGAGILMMLSRPPSGPPRSVTVAPLPAGAMRDQLDAAVLLLVRDPARVPPIAGARLVELFGLTGAEARVATALLGADSPREVAAQLGIGLATVRTHLHRLYDKTGTRRQAELVWLLATLALL